MNIKERIKYPKGIFHIHNETSRYDSPMNVEDMCRRAKELGYEALTLTDHGLLTGIDDFVTAAKKVGIKPIPGVEVYMQEDDSDYKRLHLVLIAVDDLGYQGISKIVSASNTRIDHKGFPRVNRAILEKYCAKGSPYHGHIIASSACVGGVLAGMLISSVEFDGEIKKLKEKQAKYEDPNSESHCKNLKLLAEKEDLSLELKIEKERLSTLAKKPYKKRENQVKKLEGTEDYEKELSILEAEKAETEAAKLKLETVKEEIAVAKRNQDSVKARIKDSEKSHGKFNEYQKNIDAIEAKKTPFDELYELTKREAYFFDELFGHDNFFIEIQYHGFQGNNGEPIEEAAFTHLARLAKETGIPLIAGQDAHLVDGSAKSVRARQIINSIRFAKKKFTVKVRPGDSELYIKDEVSFRKALSVVLTPEEVDEAIGNTYKVCDRCNCEYDYGTHYPKYTKLPAGETADSYLKKLSFKKICFRYPNKSDWKDVHLKRLDYELSVIATMGYSDYFLIVQDFLDFGRKLGYLSKKSIKYLLNNIKKLSLKELVDYVDSHKELPGFVIGPGRGSAAGSIVAYLTEITDIDPIAYDLLFERFLNKDRVSMPDIDSDFGKEIRILVVEYCKKLYGVETVANIVTKGYIAPKGAIRNAGRVLGLERDKEGYYRAISDKVAKMVPSVPNTSFATCEGSLRKSFMVSASDSPETKQEKYDINELLDEAKLIEGVFLNYGMHAAGVIIADGNSIDDYVPLMLDEQSGDMKVQCDMVQAEEIHGLLKFDFLGLRTLDIITNALRNIFYRTGIVIDIRNLPFDSKVFKHIFTAAKTGCVFQFESPGMKQMLRNAKPDCIEDLIALVSLYRPGPMDKIPEFIANKNKPHLIKYKCPELEPILKKTYGIIVYQEQVMEIFQRLAGYSLSDADNVRRYMSKKKLDKLEHEREAFIHGDEERGIDGCVKRGISAEVAKEIFEEMVEFAKYAFNKSHAAAYAILAYMTAYLKYYYPVEFMCAALNYTEAIKDIPSVLNDCSEVGVEVLPPEINKSNFGFSIYGDKIIFGLDSIKGTTGTFVQKLLDERELNGEFVSFKKLLLKNIIDKSTCEGMIKAGAMDEFNPNRMALENYYSSVAKILQSINKKKEHIEKVKLELEEKPEDKKIEKRLLTAQNVLKELHEQMEVVRIVNCPEDMTMRMKKEKEVLGFFVSAHPMDEYREPEELGCVPIHDLCDDGNKVTIVGLVENLKLTVTKKDSKSMAIFQLEDKTGSIDVCCFSKCYAKYGELIREDAVLKLSGYVQAEESFNDSEDDEASVNVRLQFMVNDIYEIQPDKSSINLKVRSMIDWNVMLSELKSKNLICKHGHPLVLLDELTGEFRKTYFYIKEDILFDKQFETTISD